MKILEDNERTVLTDEANQLFKKASELLSKYQMPNVDYSMHYYIIDGDDDGEYDCCGEDECDNAIMKTLKEDYPDSEIESIYTHNDGDHERIDYCSNCGVALNDSLTWVNQELQYLVDEKDDLDIESDAFSLKVVFNSMPSVDEEASGYVKHQMKLGNRKPYDQFIKRREVFYQKVADLANRVIEYAS